MREYIVSDRFYNQMLNKLGTCPGYKGKRKKRVSNWTDEKKAEVIAAYEDMSPTPETSMDCVNKIAEEFEESPNGVRMILTKAGVYVKKTATSSAKKEGGSTGTRVSKAAAQEALAKAITDAGKEADDEIISKLTGKACQYLAEVINSINS